MLTAIQGPNPWKIAILLEELGLKYELKLLEFPELKKEPYESLNPNGRVPTIQDPNTGLTIFEVRLPLSNNRAVPRCLLQRRFPRPDFG